MTSLRWGILGLGPHRAAPRPRDRGLPACQPRRGSEPRRRPFGRVRCGARRPAVVRVVRRARRVAGRRCRLHRAPQPPPRRVDDPRARRREARALREAARARRRRRRRHRRCCRPGRPDRRRGVHVPPPSADPPRGGRGQERCARSAGARERQLLVLPHPARRPARRPGDGRRLALGRRLLPGEFRSSGRRGGPRARGRLRAVRPARRGPHVRRADALPFGAACAVRQRVRVPGPPADRDRRWGGDARSRPPVPHGPGRAAAVPGSPSF